jgi:hypothetical protein
MNRSIALMTRRNLTTLISNVSLVCCVLFIVALLFASSAENNFSLSLFPGRATCQLTLVRMIGNFYVSRSRLAELADATAKRLTILAAAAITVGAVAPAAAADLPARAPATYSKAPAIGEAAYDWSGFYAGIDGSGATCNFDFRQA